MADVVHPVPLLSRRTLTLAAMLAALFPLYFVIPRLIGDHPVHAPALALDRALPVDPTWIYVYSSLYVFAFLPLFVVRQEELFCRAIQGYLLVMLIAYAGFVAYPTAAPRPAAVIGTGFAAWGLRLTYSLDSLYNCFPSLHVAESYVAAFTCYRVNKAVGMVASGWATVIAVSTLFTKQHFVVDLVAGLLLACIAYALFLRRFPRAAVADHDRRAAPRRALGVLVVFGILVVFAWVLYRTGSVVV